MKLTIRALLICFAMLLCLTPVFIACDSKDTNTDNTAETSAGDTNPDVVFEGTRIAKSINGDESMSIVLHQLAEPDANGVTKCSLVLYNAEGTVLNYVLLDFIGNGKAPNVMSLKRTTWLDDRCTAYIANADGTTPTYDIPYSK